MSDEMGTFRIEVGIASVLDPDARRIFKGVLVDIGAELSWFPDDQLEAVGITRFQETRFRQADGTVLTRWTGAAFVYAGGTATVDEVVFGLPGDLILLGARSLEGLNLRVDPVSKQLVDAGPLPVAAV